MIIQHEIDHLNGILFIDRIKDCDNTAKNTTLVGFVYSFSVKKEKILIQCGTGEKYDNFLIFFRTGDNFLVFF